MRQLEMSMQSRGSTDAEAPQNGDDGFALLAAVAIMSLVTVFITTMMTFALRENRSSGRDRQRSSAVTTAEGAVDATLANMTGLAPTAMPCGTTTTTPTVGPDTFSIATSVTYYDATGSAVSCPLTASTTATKALVKSIATSSRLQGGFAAKREFETEVSMKATLAATGGGVFNKAVFGNTSIVTLNKADIYGYNNQPNADLYSNGDISCANNENFHGSVISAGNLSLSNSCTIDVDAYAKGTFSASSPQATVSGNVYAYTSANVTKGSIGGLLYSPSISGAVCSGNPKCKTQAPPVTFPTQTFPQLNYVASDWTAAGYTAVNFASACGSSASTNGPGQWLINNAATLTAPTVLITSCPVVLTGNNGNLKLAQNLAIFAGGGFLFSNNTGFDSTSTTARSLFMIQPYNSIAMPCTTGINLGNLVSFTQYVNDFMYTPCNVVKANNSTHFGQIYAGGTAEIDNQLTMYYVPVSVPGQSSGGSGSGVQSYQLDVNYQREDNS